MKRPVGRGESRAAVPSTSMLWFYVCGRSPGYLWLSEGDILKAGCIGSNSAAALRSLELFRVLLPVVLVLGVGKEGVGTMALHLASPHIPTCNTLLHPQARCLCWQRLEALAWVPSSWLLCCGEQPPTKCRLRPPAAGLSAPVAEPPDSPCLAGHSRHYPAPVVGRPESIRSRSCMVLPTATLGARQSLNIQSART